MSYKNPSHGHRDRVREKFAKLGSFDSYQPYEVLELLLFYAIPRRDTKVIAKNLIATFGSLKGVFEADIDTLKKQPGVGLSTAVFLHSYSELATYLSGQVAESIRGSGDMGAYSVNLMMGKTVEELYVVALNPKNVIINSKKLASGKFSSVTADVRQIIGFAMDCDADKIVLIHNHTNGSVTPSGDDVTVTMHIADIAGKLGITVVDHIITCQDRYVSMASSGVLGKESK